VTLQDTINSFYMPLFNKNEDVVEYYADIFEGINCLIWEATQTKANMQASNWQTCRSLTGWLGLVPTLPGA
jgi:hypothetical protein